MTLDPKAAEARAVVKRLAADTHIVIDKFRPGTLERWGLGWQDLSQLNPRLVMMRISG